MTRTHRIALAVLLATLAGCSSLLGPKDTPTKLLEALAS